MKTAERIVMVYGSFIVPNTPNGVNFILFRMPEGRTPWSKKIAPAINRLVKKWYPPDEREPYWNVDWDSYDEVWRTKKTRKFEWKNENVIEVVQEP